VRTLTAEDDCGNSISHSYTISSIDTEPPLLPDLANIEIECDEYDESYEECEVNAISEGDEDLEVILPSHTVYLEPGDCPALFEIHKVWTVTDCAGFTTTTEQKVTVRDDTAPVLSRIPEPEIVTECDCDDFVVAADLKAYDNCEEVSVEFTEVSNPGDCPEEYSLTRTWYAADSCGNSVETIQEVTILDNGNPEFCDDDDIYDEAFPCNGVPTWESLIPEAADSCDPDVEVTWEDISDEAAPEPDCEDEYTLVYEYTATDNCGNEATTTRTYQIEDGEAPILADDDKYCLYQTYGDFLGSWAQYNIDVLFRPEDNCDETPTLDYGSLICNATDNDPYDNVPKTDGVAPGTQGTVDCFFRKTAGEHFVWLKIDRESVDSPSEELGRTYHIFATVSDTCGNSAIREREVFIPLDAAIYRHVQPCGTGDPNYESSPPVVLPGGGGSGPSINFGGGGAIGR